MFFFQGDVGIGSFWKDYDAFEAAGCHVAWCVVEGGCVDFKVVPAGIKKASILDES